MLNLVKEFDHRLPENRKRLSCIGEPKNSPGVGVWNGQDALAQGDENISGLLFDQALFESTLRCQERRASSSSQS